MNRTRTVTVVCDLCDDKPVSGIFYAHDTDEIISVIFIVTDDTSKEVARYEFQDAFRYVIPPGLFEAINKSGRGTKKWEYEWEIAKIENFRPDGKISKSSSLGAVEIG